MKRNGIKTNDMDNSLATYLREINRIPMLDRDEEEKTARAAAAGDKAARDKLVSANLRFVVNVAKRYQGLGLPLEDLISEGNTGLLYAADRFDVEMGYHFISYAVWWIRQTIMSALYEKARMIRLPANKAASLVKIEQARKTLKSQHSSEEEIKELAGLLNMDKKKVADLVNISRETLSLETSISNESDLMLKDHIEDDRYNSPYADTERRMIEAGIDEALDTLKKYEADIIRCHFGLGRQAMSLKEIGTRYNLSKERIRQIEERALSRLRNPSRTGKLQAYVA
ncbi:MAG: RNA polymerase sigma factor RpoD/SigA [Treponema sp.]|jgi:RNA polymerase primary sigma factor|nr:RNA polymerase sigma factor RpoD/SigA [Treponema sp.]